MNDIIQDNTSSHGEVILNDAFPLLEISFKSYSSDTMSESSSHPSPSTLTPIDDHRHLSNNVNDDDQQQQDSSCGSYRGRQSRLAFQIAAMLGMLSLGLLFGADFVSMANNNSKNSQQRQQPQQRDSYNSFDTTADAYHPKAERSSTTRPTMEEFDDNNYKEEFDPRLMKAKADKAGKNNKKKKDKAGKMIDDEYYRIISDDEVNVHEEDQDDDNDNVDDTNPSQINIGSSTEWNNISIPESYNRCSYVIQTFQDLNEGVTDMSLLRDKYITQSVDYNVFYRATALLFWKDFGSGQWGAKQDRSINLDDLVLLKYAKYGTDGTPISPRSTWTWITGDQHLSNFGAWRNRGGNVVFSVNDFDEAAIYDFHIDVLRLAVSICNHGFTNGLNDEEVRDALEAFTYTYVKTVIDYVWNDRALLFELDSYTSKGALRDFLVNVENEMSLAKQMHKFTEVGHDGMRRFIRDDDTRLEDVPERIERKIREEITSTRYGATMMHMGWKVRGWDDDFFTVLDVVRRVDSGVGSYGVDRYYVLLKGEDVLLEEEEGVLSSSVILDVKFEPVSSVSRIINDIDYPDRDVKAWYKYMFRNDADRASQAQQRLTSYTDPFVGYLDIDGETYIVRQRSPYKSSFNIDTLKHSRAFSEFTEQVAIETATAVRHPLYPYYFSCVTFVQVLTFSTSLPQFLST
jgi:uncharacterized protein (DUF2252 family)